MYFIIKLRVTYTMLTTMNALRSNGLDQRTVGRAGAPFCLAPRGRALGQHVAGPLVPIPFLPQGPPNGTPRKLEVMMEFPVVLPDDTYPSSRDFCTRVATSKARTFLYVRYFNKKIFHIFNFFNSYTIKHLKNFYIVIIKQRG